MNSAAHADPAPGRARQDDPRADVYLPDDLSGSGALKVVFADAGHVDVTWSPTAIPHTEEFLREQIALAMGAGASARAGGLVHYLARHVNESARRFLEEVFRSELERVVVSYRLMLRESLATGDDEALRAALNQARLQERILAGVTMVEQADACQLLGLSASNPSSTMGRKEGKGEIMRFTIDGRAVYPLFQFDIERRRIQPAIKTLLAMKPKRWSDFRLLHWLVSPHLDFDDTPAVAMADQADAVVSAFGREIEPTAHG
jgi:hypothetical protein